MIISLRTFINTTLFRFVLFLLLVLYTNIRNPVPAQKFMDMIGWSKLVSSNAWGYLSSDQLIINKLANIEQICGKSIRLYMYDQMPMLPSYSSSVQPAITYPVANPSPFVVPTSSTNASISTGTIPVINNALGSGLYQ